MSQATEVKEEVIAEVKDKAEEAAEAVKTVAKKAKEKAEGAVEKAAEKAKKVKAEAEEAGEKAAEKVKKTTKKVAEKVGEVKTEAAEKVEEIKEEAAEKAADLKAELSEKLEEAKAEAAEKAEEVKEAAAEKAEEIKEAAAEKAEEIKAGEPESMADLKEELEASLKQGPPTDDPVWARFEELLESKEPIPVKIDSVVKGGVIAFVDGVRGFIPASKAAATHVDDLESLKGLETEAVIITADRAGGKLVLSVRDALRKKEKAERAAAMAECVEGAVLEGTVDSVMDYGAFIKLPGGISGLLHVSQISYDRVEKPSDVLKQGDPITVKIIGIKDGKISLSKKALEEAPARKERAPRGDRSEREPRDGERRPRERREREEVFNYKETGKATTSLGDLLSGIKLD